MKKTIFLISMFSISVCILGQESPAIEDNSKIHEVGITFRGLDRFGFIYKVGKSSSLWRMEAFTLNGSSRETKDRENDSLESSIINYGGGLSFGREHRKSLTEKFELRYGLDVQYSYRYSTNKQNNTSQRTYQKTTNFHNVGLEFIFGFNFVAKKQLVIGAEIDLGVYYRFGYEKENDTFIDGSSQESISDVSQYNFGLSNYPAQLTIAYRF